MNVRKIASPRMSRARSPKTSIFDVDGVLLASPHEQAWREALSGFADPVRFTTAMYQAQVAGSPDIFLLVARELEIAPINCLVVKDAAAGISSVSHVPFKSTEGTE